MTSDVINEGLHTGTVDMTLQVGGHYTNWARWGMTRQEVLDADWEYLPTQAEVTFSYIQHRIEVTT